jgi:hypothetical protein
MSHWWFMETRRKGWEGYISIQPHYMGKQRAMYRVVGYMPLVGHFVLKL